jgi:hypothetical protein
VFRSCAHRLLSKLSRGDLAGGHRPRRLTGQSFGLRGKMTGHACIEPALNLGGQIKDFDSHCSRPI